MAERGGFEPPVGYKPTHAFQACALNHSAISPAHSINSEEAFEPTQYFSERNPLLRREVSVLGAQKCSCAGQGWTSLKNLCRPDMGVVIDTRPALVTDGSLTKDHETGGARFVADSN
jgi:hypothetical protein